MYFQYFFPFLQLWLSSLYQNEFSDDSCLTDIVCATMETGKLKLVFGQVKAAEKVILIEICCFCPMKYLVAHKQGEPSCLDCICLIFFSKIIIAQNNLKHIPAEFWKLQTKKLLEIFPIFRFSAEKFKKHSSIARILFFERFWYIHPGTKRQKKL